MKHIDYRKKIELRVNYIRFSISYFDFYFYWPYFIAIDTVSFVAETKIVIRFPELSRDWVNWSSVIMFFGLGFGVLSRHIHNAKLYTERDMK